MKKRRKSGEWVWVQWLQFRKRHWWSRHRSDILTWFRAQIQYEVYPRHCSFHNPLWGIAPSCDDADCREWATLLTLPDQKTGPGSTFCGVGECKMFDQAGELPA